MSWDEDAYYDTSLDIPSGKYGKLVAIPGGPGPSGPPGPEGPASTVPGPPGPAGSGASSWDEVSDKPEGVPGGFPVLDSEGNVPVENLPDVYAASIMDSSEVGRAVVTAADAPAARAAINIDGQVIGTADDLPNESGFWWTSEPVAVDGKVYMGTVAADQGSWVQEWTQTDPDGPFYLHRYFMGFAQTTASGPQLGRDNLRDDHNPAQCAVKAGKPLVVFWSGHGTENLMYYRVSDQAVDAVRPGELTFGPIKSFAVPVDQRTSYTEVMVDGDDIWVAHRTGYNVNQWTLTKFPAWATGTPVSRDLVVTPIVGGVANQLYMKARMVDGVIRCLVSTHPTNSVAAYNKIWYVEANAATGAVTKSDGTVLGNLDGTNLPLDVNASLEVVFTATGTSRPWGFDVGYGPVRELAFTDGVPSNFAATAKYRVSRNTGSGWTTGEVTSVGNYLSTSTGVYFPSITFVPGLPDKVLLARATGVATGVNYVEKWATADNGATWAVSEVVDEVPVDFTAGPLRALTRAYPVRVESGVTPFDVIGTEILEYPDYSYGWEMRVRPLPLSHTIRRVPADDPILRGLRTEKTSPRAGLYVPALTGNYIEGPTSEATVPTEGIRLEVDVALPNWVPGVDKTLLGKESTASLRGPRLVLSAVGRIGLYWSEDGSTFQNLIPTEVPLPPFAPWQRVQIAVDFIPKHAHPTTAGGFQRTLRSFYRFSDDEPWVGLGNAANSPGTAMHKGGTSPWEVGSRRLGTTDQTEGVFYRASVMKIGGEVLAEWRAGQMSYRGTGADAKGNTWTVRSPNMEFRNPILLSPKMSSIVDPDSNILVAGLDAKGTSATPKYLSIFSADTNPGLEAVGATDTGIQMLPKGTGAFRIYSNATPILEGFSVSGNADFRIVTQSVGRVLINGVQAETKGHTHVAADVAGAAQWVAVPTGPAAAGTAGQLSADATHLYVCLAANTWRTVALDVSWKG